LVLSGPEGIVIGAQALPVRKWRITGVGVIAHKNSRNACGIVLKNAPEGVLDDVLMFGFGRGGAGLCVGDNSWTVLLDNVTVSTNAAGIRFRGTNTNAWIVRASIVLLNEVGVVFEMGAGV